MHLDEATAWIDLAINNPFFGNKDFTALSVKAEILDSLGRHDEASKIMREAIYNPTATALNIHFYARSLQLQGKDEEALEILKRIMSYTLMM